MRRHEVRLGLTVTVAAAFWLVAGSQSRSQDLPEFVAKARPSVSGIVLIQSFGDYQLKNAEWSGSKSLARQLEGISLKLDAPEDLLRVEYRCNVEDVGNIGWFAKGSTCGVQYQGQPKRLEAIQIRLAGRASGYFTIKYECHIQGIGDMPAQADGETCGTYGQARRLEAMRVWIERRP